MEDEKMEPIQYPKDEWGPGPWHNEPDRVDFESHGLPCLILRNRGGALCGYVAVPPEHPLHGVAHNEPCPALRERARDRWGEPVNSAVIPAFLAACRPDEDPRPEWAFSAHGGLTYSGACSGRICHVPREGQAENVWWFGFDCGHAGDLVPQQECLFGSFARGFSCGGTYRSVDYVRAQVETLAQQLSEVK
jgi:hypothetical protein